MCVVWLILSRRWVAAFRGAFSSQHHCAERQIHKAVAKPSFAVDCSHSTALSICKTESRVSASVCTQHSFCSSASSSSSASQSCDMMSMQCSLRTLRIQHYVYYSICSSIHIAGRASNATILNYKCQVHTDASDAPMHLTSEAQMCALCTRSIECTHSVVVARQRGRVRTGHPGKASMG